jgi:hypothetical protein
MQGHEAVVEREVARRSAGAAVLQTAYDVAVHLLDEADDAFIDALAVSLVVWLRGKANLGSNKGGRRLAFIYGSSGELPREVELPVPDDG